jgi:agmatine deiminase
MHLRALLLVFTICFFSTLLYAQQSSSYIFPGEYESHEAMWLAWPTYENKRGFSSTLPMMQMINAAHGKVRVHLLVADVEEEKQITKLLSEKNIPTAHIKFFHIPHNDVWIRDMGPQFVRNENGQLKIIDWNFNLWGHEESYSEASRLEESIDSIISGKLTIPLEDASKRKYEWIAPDGDGNYSLQMTSEKFVHEGGSVSHNGKGTMIAIESVVMQRLLGPTKFCGGSKPLADPTSPTTYKENADWPACKALVEQEYKTRLGVQKIIWIPTGVVEDDGAFRGALFKDIKIPEYNGITIPHAGVYPVFTTNGHADEFIRFVNEDVVMLAHTEKPELNTNASALDKLVFALENENYVRLARARAILEAATTADGKPLSIVNIPTPEFMFDVYEPGDEMYEYYKAYQNWEDGSSLGEKMFAVLPTSYANFFPTNDLILLAEYWKPGRSEAIKNKDAMAAQAIKNVFPDRTVATINEIENINRGGGGINCSTQQQPASGTFADACGWVKVKHSVPGSILYTEPGKKIVGEVKRFEQAENTYLKVVSRRAGWLQVSVKSKTKLNGKTGWISATTVEAAGEMCE